MSSAAERWARVRRLVEAARERNAEDVLVLDVSELTSFADTFVVASGSSDRNVRAIVDAVVEAAARLGDRPLGIEGYTEGRWVLVDLVDVIVHVFLPAVREEYDLERLYADAPVVELTGARRRGRAR
jgi:ribosome-associated protein